MPNESGRMSPRIPTNLITGFLGVGKTTAILHLLKHKPAHEKWAVLVNEFGEIGIDGAILEQSGAAIREVAGGCICCVANLPLQIGLNTLIARAKPDRILVEPTGLGHPQNIVDLLGNDYYGALLELQAIVALVDARKIADVRYTENSTFRDQLQIADCVIANKVDQASTDDIHALTAFLAQLNPPATLFAQVQQGAVVPEWLHAPHVSQAARMQIPAAHDLSLTVTQSKYSLAPTLLSPPSLSPSSLPPLALANGQRYIRRESQGLGFVSCGWLFAGDTVFNMNRLFSVLHGLDVQRLKGIVNTDQGAFILNMENGVLSVNDAGAAVDSRIEIIHTQALPWQQLDDVWLGAVLAD